MDGSDFLFEWELQDIDVSKTDIFSPKFSFQGIEFDLNLWKEEGDMNYGCYLSSVKPSSKPGIIHYRFDLVKRLDNTITKFHQGTHKLKELHEGWGPGDWIDPATIRGHILKVKAWTSEYEFEYDMEDSDITNPSFPDPFWFDGNKLHVVLKKNEGGTKYDFLLKDVESAISSKMYFQVDLFKRLDNLLVKSEKFEFFFNKKGVEQGFEDCFEVESIREYIIKVKVLIFKPFSDFVEKPIGFENAGFLLFNKMACNLSFSIGDEIVYTIHAILTSRSDYFRAMLEGSFKEAQVPMTVESKIPVHGIDVDVFKMIIEWIYTMDIKSLNVPISPSLLLDLQVYHHV
jgi:hypothetical protein